MGTTEAGEEPHWVVEAGDSPNSMPMQRWLLMI